MDKNDIIKYVMETPQNTNKAVLESMLNSFDNASANNEITYMVPPQKTTLVENNTGFSLGVLSNVDFSNINDKDFLLYKILIGPNENETYDDETITNNLYIGVSQYSENSNIFGFENIDIIFGIQQFGDVWLCTARDEKNDVSITGIIEVIVEKIDMSNIIDAIDLELIVTELPQIDIGGETGSGGNPGESSAEEIPG